VPNRLPLVCAQHASIVQQHAIHFPHALEGVEEADEEHHGHSQRDFRPDPKPKPQQKDRRQHYARKHICNPDIGVEQRRQPFHSRQQKAESNSQSDADHKRERGLTQRHTEMRPH